MYFGVVHESRYDSVRALHDAFPVIMSGSLDAKMDDRGPIGANSKYLDNRLVHGRGPGRKDDILRKRVKAWSGVSKKSGTYETFATNQSLDDVFTHETCRPQR